MKARLVDVKEIMRVGPKYAAILNDYGIYTVLDLLNVIPKEYLFITPIDSEDIKEEELVTIIGRVVVMPTVVKINSKLKKASFELLSNGKLFKVTFFNQDYLVKLLYPGRVIHVRGRLNKLNFLANDIFFDEAKDFCIVKYSITDIPGKILSSFFRNALKLNLEFEEDILPKRVIEAERLATYPEIYELIHFPKSQADVEIASKRFRTNELISFFLKTHYYKHLKDMIYKEPKRVNYPLIERFISTLPFSLTSSQLQATKEILSNLEAPKAMSRLLQGDVGSGKTIVALLAAYATVDCGYQVAIMAPTEILATEHYNTFRSYLSVYGINIALLSSSVKEVEKEAIITSLKRQEIDIIIGTHSLLNEQIEYPNLGLVVIDEQQRFGVVQRNKLLAKNKIDALFLSATPIPRTLALTIAKDLDISSLTDAVPTRKERKTKIVSEEKIADMFKWMLSYFKEGKQAFFVAPYIDNPEGYDLDAIERLTKKYLPNIRTMKLSGVTKASEKDRILEQFKLGLIDVIIATTVIEVGINYPNANLLVVFEAERFGLCTLHQLRGRVGRGELESYAFFVTNDKTNPRLKALQQTKDGFALSEIDLKLRGPGEYFGLRQSGIPEVVFKDDIDTKQLKRYSDIAYNIFSIAKSDDKSSEYRYCKHILKTYQAKGDLN